MAGTYCKCGRFVTLTRDNCPACGREVKTPAIESSNDEEVGESP